MSRRLVIPLLLAAAVGLMIAALVNIPALVGPWSIPKLIANAFTFWGILSGAFAAVVTFGLALVVLNRRHPRVRRWGRGIAGITLAVFALGLLWWGSMFGIQSPFSLEGLWLYPLVITTGTGAFLLLRRPKPGFWDDPPPSTTQ